MFFNRNRFFPKHAECLIRLMKNNSLVQEKPAETQLREDEE